MVRVVVLLPHPPPHRLHRPHPHPLPHSPTQPYVLSPVSPIHSELSIASLPISHPPFRVVWCCLTAAIEWIEKRCEKTAETRSRSFPDVRCRSLCCILIFLRLLYRCHRCKSHVT